MLDEVKGRQMLGSKGRERTGALWGCWDCVVGVRSRGVESGGDGSCERKERHDGRLGVHVDRRLGMFCREGLVLLLLSGLKRWLKCWITVSVGFVDLIFIPPGRESLRHARFFLPSVSQPTLLHTFFISRPPLQGKHATLFFSVVGYSRRYLSL